MWLKDILKSINKKPNLMKTDEMDVYQKLNKRILISFFKLIATRIRIEKPGHAQKTNGQQRYRQRLCRLCARKRWNGLEASGWELGRGPEIGKSKGETTRSIQRKFLEQ